MKPLSFFVIFFFLLFTACQTQTATLQPTAIPIFTATAASATIPATQTPHPAVVPPTPTSKFGESVASAFNVTPSPSPTFGCGCPKATATPFPTVPAAEFLPNRYHLWAETAGFIHSLPWTEVNFVSAYPETNEGLDEVEQEARAFQWADFEFSLEAQQIFEDINGDGADDLIVTDVHLVAIFLWQETAYQTPFIWLSDYPLIASLEDWTADGVNELVYQEAYYDHWGTGVFNKGWGPTVIYCQLTRCDNEEWQNPEWVKIPPQAETTYTWTGEIFTKTDYITIPTTVVLPEVNTVAEHPQFGIAQVQIEPNYSATDGNDVCLVLWQETPITGRPFGCKEGLTNLYWQDVTQDGQAELIAHTTSGYNPTFGEKYGWESEEIDCIHQRLLVYGMQNGRLSQIADVVGCVVNDTLFGVRFEDIDQDGQVEILSGGRSWYGEPICYHYAKGYGANYWQGYDPRPETYIWNGSLFVLAP